MYTLVIVLHVLASLALILIVLLQTGRGAEMGAAFGGASQTLFGGSGGTTFMSKLTTAAAIIFMLTCLGLTYFSAAPDKKSIMESVPVEKPQGPALPEARPVQPMPAQPAVNEPAQSQETGAAAEKPASQAQEATKAEPQPATPPASEDAKQEKPPTAKQ